MLIEDSAKVAGDPCKDTVWCCSYGLAIDEEHGGAEERVGRSGGTSDEKNETQFPSYGFKLLDENDTYDNSDIGLVFQQVPRSVPSAPLQAVNRPVPFVQVRYLCSYCKRRIDFFVLVCDRGGMPDE